MSTHAQTEARALRSRLSHPVIDADGHWAEFYPLMRQEFRRIGGDTAVEALAMASDGKRNPEITMLHIPPVVMADMGV